jgi:hypothetical protein
MPGTKAVLMATVLMGGIALGFASAPLPVHASEAKLDREDCTLTLDGRTFPLKGRVQFVESFPDFTVRYVDAFADLHVRQVEAFPDECGKWQRVEAFPDFKVKAVDAFEDLRIRTVESFPGLQRP